LPHNGVAMKFAGIAFGAAALVALASQSASAQSSPAMPPDAPADALPPGAAQPAGPPAVVGTNVNLRQGPGTTYTIITTIPAGAPIEVSGCQGQWCQVSWQGQNGYVIATSLGQGAGAPPPGGPPPGAVAGGPPPPPPPGYYGGPVYPPPPPYYGPYPYGYGYGPYYGYRGYWHRHW
jgi:hypothetical protein